jgi:hypothetical protein
VWPATWRGLACAMMTVPVDSAGPRHADWPDHLPVGALRVVRWSARYDQTVSFYPDTIGLPVLETFQDSYGLDGIILGLPSGPVHLEIVRLRDAPQPAHGLDQLVFYLPDVAHQERITARLAAAGDTQLGRSTTGRPTAASLTGPRRARRGVRVLDLSAAEILIRADGAGAHAHQGSARIWTSSSRLWAEAQPTTQPPRSLEGGLMGLQCGLSPMAGSAATDSASTSAAAPPADPAITVAVVSSRLAPSASGWTTLGTTPSAAATPHNRRRPSPTGRRGRRQQRA